jgi:hypothetical protein
VHIHQWIYPQDRETGEVAAIQGNQPILLVVFFSFSMCLFACRRSTNRDDFERQEKQKKSNSLGGAVEMGGCSPLRISMDPADSIYRKPADSL